MSQSSLQYAFASRGITAGAVELADYVTEAIAQMEEGALIPAVEDLPAAELAVLRSGGFVVERGPVAGEDPLARAAAAYAALLETALTIKVVAQALGRNESRIRQRLLERSLIGIRRGRGWLLPRYQFQVQEQDGQPVVRALVPGIEQVFPRLSPELHPVALWRWFSSPSTELVPEDEDAPLSPRDWLIAGRDPAMVARLAAGL
jgi:hypothetical protein